MSDRPIQSGMWKDESDELDREPRRLTHEEARALAAKDPSVSPWRVIGVQAALGVALAVLAWAFFEDRIVAWSALYGAATVVLPGALMARGMTSRLSSVSPLASAASFMFWEMLKLGVSVAMLVLAPTIVPGVNWPALLVALFLGVKVYWVALLWRGRIKTTSRRG